MVLVDLDVGVDVVLEMVEMDVNLRLEVSGCDGDGCSRWMRSCLEKDITLHKIL